jgi:hypothetical protein
MNDRSSIPGRGMFLRVMRPEREADHSPPSSARSYISTHFTVWCLGTGQLYHYLCCSFNELGHPACFGSELTCVKL